MSRGLPSAMPSGVALVPALLVALLALARPAQAQFAIDRTELQLHPDVATARAGVLLVRNEGAERSQARILIEDWDRAEDGSNRFYPAGTLAGSCAKSLEVHPRTLVLEPGEVQPVRITIESGTAAQRQECWSVVLVESVQPRPSASGRMLLYTLRTGVKVYATPATVEPEAELAALSLAPAASVATSVTPAASPAASTTSGGPSATASLAGTGTPRDLPREVQLAFVNRGAKHVAAHGRLEVRREDNRVVTAVPLPMIYALPGATRRMAVALPALPRGRYLLLAVFDYGGAELTAAQLEVEVP